MITGFPRRGRHRLRVRHPLAPAAAAVAAVVAFAAYLHWPATSSSVPSVTPFDETNANGPVTLFGRGADRKVVRVVDGDTVDAAGPNGTDRLRYRLIGFDTPARRTTRAAMPSARSASA